MQSYQSQQANFSHVQQLQSWFANEQELIIWGGPGLKFGLSSDEFAQQIKLSILASHVLVVRDEVLAFGQFYVRLGRHHFGRLAVAPQHRGKRLSYHLIAMLADKARNVQTGNGYSLFVWPDNAPAIRTYQNIGFNFAPYPQQIPEGFSTCLYMTTESLLLPAG